VNKIFRQSGWIVAVIGILFTSTASWAQTPEERGYSIAEKNEISDRGFADSRADFKMILKNATGKTSSRELEVMTLEVTDLGLGDKSMTIFGSPADIKGTALLSHAKILDPDDQWLYLPALKRVKRISSVNKSGPFVGSEFAFEDFTSTELGKYDYKYLREEACGDLTCNVVERYPKYEHSGYTRQISWFDTQDHQLRSVEFYDRKDTLLKTLKLNDYRLYLDRYWRAHQLLMKNHQTGKETSLEYSNFEFQTGLTDADFVKNTLSRRR
jgi:outer membrane lipoprotein-sorting protein